MGGARTVVALGRGASGGREWRFVLISNGRVRRGDLSRRAAPAEAGFRRLNPPPRGWQRREAADGRRRCGCESEGAMLGRRVALECGGRGRASLCPEGYPQVFGAAAG
jgi:hypothetical protein